MYHSEFALLRMQSQGKECLQLWGTCIQLCTGCKANAAVQYRVDGNISQEFPHGHFDHLILELGVYNIFFLS
jgi:hypothetical protein